MKSLYKNVRIPWLLILVGAVLAVFNSVVILTQYENYMAIFTGALTDLSPLFQYLAACFIQYLLIFASILSDIAFVTIVTGVRKKMWRKMVRLPLKDYEKESPGGMLFPHHFRRGICLKAFLRRHLHSADPAVHYVAGRYGS